ncbi:MAG: Lrp/AsnC family transcriptional regulator [Candidatus Bathyarchaeota archaeon]|nr:Lrp/AsnC family transcriptional regulator [Candidatus Bathyarchaeota archaeon]
MDATDLKIIDMLKANARISFSDISREIGLSTPTIRERILNLEGDGVIKGYIPLLDNSRLGLNTTAFIGVTLDHPQCCREDVVKAIARMPEVVEAHFTDGDEDMILKVVCKDTTALLRLLSELTASEGVARTRSVISLSNEIERT